MPMDETRGTSGDGQRTVGRSGLGSGLPLARTLLDLLGTARTVSSSLRGRLTLSHLFVIVLAMGLSGFLLLSFVERYFLEAAEESLLAQARITAQAMLPGVLEGTGEGVALAPAFNTVQQQLSSNLSLQTQNLSVPDNVPSLSAVDLTNLADASLQLSTQLQTRIRILDERGRLLIDSGREAGGVPGSNLGADPLVARALAGTYSSRVEKGAGSPSMALAVPVMVRGRLVGVVYLSQPLRDVMAVLRDLRTRLLLSAGLGLMLSAVVGLLLSRAISTPLRRLTEASGAIARGELEQHLPVRSRDEVGRLTHAFNDMTSRLRAARQMQMDLVANVSHELRTPLTAVKGTVETLRAGAVDDRQVRDRFLETIESETDRLIRLVNDLLLLSRADAEALNLRQERVDLTALVEAAIERLAPRARRRGVSVVLEADPDLPPAWADVDRLAQVLFNLLDNAIKYSHPASEVLIDLRAARDRSLCVRVRDEGIGIPVEELTRIGQRFYRADKARSRTAGGSGLGLAIAQTLVQAHGGQLWVESQEGVGTTVGFWLPAP